MPKRIAIVNGPNLNLLGVREPQLYGSLTLPDLQDQLQGLAKELGVELTFFQSNHEGALLDHLHSLRETHAGVVFNPGGYAHTSVALRDAVSAIAIPVIEVHLTNIHTREEFRRHSIVAGACRGSVVGLGIRGYEMALRVLAS